MSQEKKLHIRNSTAEFLIFTRQAGDSGIEVRVAGETVWLTQKLMAVLFEVTVPTVNEHLKNLFADGEIQETSVIRKFRTTAADGISHFTAAAPAPAPCPNLLLASRWPLNLSNHWNHGISVRRTIILPLLGERAGVRADVQSPRQGWISAQKHKMRVRCGPAPRPLRQRRCASKPRVATQELPWVKGLLNPQPQRGCARVQFHRLLLGKKVFPGSRPGWLKMQYVGISDRLPVRATIRDFRIVQKVFTLLRPGRAHSGGGGNFVFPWRARLGMLATV